MNTPSIKTLREIFGDNAKKAKAILDAHPNSLSKLVRKYPVAYSAFQGGAYDAYVCMLALNALGEFNGIEARESEQSTFNYPDYAEFLNAGDTYTCTLIHWRGRYRVQDLGTFIETQERRGIRFK